MGIENGVDLLIVIYPPDLVAMVLFIQKNGKIIITNTKIQK